MHQKEELPTCSGGSRNFAREGSRSRMPAHYQLRLLKIDW